MAASSATTKSFLGSLALLLLAVVVFLFVFLPGKKGPEAPVVKPAASDQDLKNSRRQSMRQPRSEDPAEVRAHETAVGTGTAAKSDTPATTALSDDPLANEPEVQRAIAMIDNGQVSEAIALLEGVLKGNPRNENALVELAMIYLLDMKQPEQAMGYLQRVLDINPNNQVVLSELVSLYEEQGKIDDGLAYMQEVASRNPNSPDLAYGVGQMLSLQNRDAEAIPFLEKAAQSPENQVRAYRDLAEAYSRAGDGEKSVDSYNRALQAQEREIAEKKAAGLPVTFAEERLNYTKMDKARELIRIGDLEAAQTLIDEISVQMPGDESVTALQDSINKKRAG